MILERMILKDFRQFKGDNEFNFACSSKAEGPNITVIWGKNGRGKTGLYRALMFCLCGESKLAGETEALDLVNHRVVRDGEGSGSAFEGRVVVSFTHRDARYEIERTIRATRSGGRQVEVSGPAVLRIDDPDGNTTVVHDPVEIESRMDSVLDRRVREYFLFDGDKMEHLFDATATQRREVGKGVRNLLNVDALERAIRICGKMAKEFQSDVVGKSTGDLAKVLEEIRVLQEEREKVEGAQDGLEGELHLAEDQQKVLRKQLEEARGLQAFLRLRDELQESITTDKAHLQQLLVRMGGGIHRASLLLVKDKLKAAFDQVDSKREAGEIPSAIREELIDLLISEDLCICQRRIKEYPEAFSAILAWKNRAVDSRTEDSALGVWRELGSVLDQIDSIEEWVEAGILDYSVTRNGIEQAGVKLKDVSGSIGTAEGGAYEQLEAEWESVDDARVKLQAQRSAGLARLHELEDQEKVLRARRERLEKERGVLNEIEARAVLAQGVTEVLRQVRDGYTVEMRKSVGDMATDFFKRLLTVADRKTLDRVIVNDDYSLDILDEDGVGILANISMGQRQVMALSFIAALARAAARSDVLEMPLFMDTPFGRLDSEHRANLISEIPEFAAQWVLLATDTELRPEEARQLDAGGRLGAFYHLRPDKDAGTLVHSVPVDEMVAYVEGVAKESAGERQ